MYGGASATRGVSAVAFEERITYSARANSDAIKKRKNFNDFRLSRAQA